MEIITYKKSREGHKEYKNFLISLIENHNLVSICDIGGGANPILDLKYIKNKNIEYSILDISETELNKAPIGYSKVLADISDPQIKINCGYDLIFSKMLAEHIKDGKQFHKNTFKLLNNNGIAVHFFPTLYSLPFIINLLIPEKLASKVLHYLMPNRDSFQHAKFPAYYNWCRGPLKSQISKFNNIGFKVFKYIGLFGHENYYNKFKVLRRLHKLKTDYLLKYPLPLLTSFAIVVLKKVKSV